jgi:hypothetical protein
MTISSCGKSLEAIDVVVLERRDFAVLLRRQALQHRVAGVNDERPAAGLRHGTDEIAHEGILLDLVDADAVLDRHRDGNRAANRSYAVTD